jgi:hypothetical protein
MDDIGLRESFNDLWVWDTKTDSHWAQIDGQGSVPKRRMHHATAILGGILLVMGGINTESKLVMDDFNLFDFASNTWIQVRMVKERDRTKFKPKCFIQNDIKTKDP